MTESTMRRRILAIDGGGVRGIIPALALEALEAATGKLARESFDFLAGTSTGAVIAAAVGAGIPAERVVSLYRRRGPELFRRIPVLSLLRRIVIGNEYEVATLRRMIGEELGDLASWRINDVPRDIMITAKALADGHQWYFVKDRPGEPPGKTGAFPLADCVTASAAAPTYFAPWSIAGKEFVDGGVGVTGNPVYQACVEAFRYSGYDPSNTIVVSLGTGRFLDRRRPTWLWSWVEWVLGEMFRSPGEQQTELVQRHYAEATLSRIDVRLPRDFPLDTVGPGLKELEEIGRNLVRQIDWPAILEGRDDRFRVGSLREAQPPGYLRVVN